MLDTCAW